jgi:hypothetical protein
MKCNQEKKPDVISIKKVSFIWLGVFLCTVLYNTSVSAVANSELRTVAVNPSTVKSCLKGLGHEMNSFLGIPIRLNQYFQYYAHKVFIYIHAALLKLTINTKFLPTYIKTLKLFCNQHHTISVLASASVIRQFPPVSTTHRMQEKSV